MSDPRFIQPGFDKCLAHFIEECGETLQAAGKTLRFGRDSVNPLTPKTNQETNEQWLIRELKDLKESIARLEIEIGFIEKKGVDWDNLKHDGLAAVSHAASGCGFSKSMNAVGYGADIMFNHIKDVLGDR